MRIDAITCCVGAGYAERLARALPVWADTLDSLVVVTKPSCDATRRLVDELDAPNVRVVTTDVFTEHGATFNKAAALCVAYAACDPLDWVLHADADVVPPADWRARSESRLRKGCLHGCRRQLSDGADGDNGERFWPYGYFQLWHTSDSAAWGWPIFDVRHRTCGGYDADFSERWSRARWRELPFRVKHVGEPRSNWCGEGADDAEMRRMKQHGLYRYRKEGLGHIVLPTPKLRYAIAPRFRDEAKMRSLMRVVAIGGPFAVQLLRLGPVDCRVLTESTKFTDVQREVLACLESGPTTRSESARARSS